MKCPYCGGEFEAIDLRSSSGGVLTTNHCTQCGGFWFDREPEESFSPESVAQYDVAAPNYSLKAFDMVCPIDQTIMEENDPGDGPAGSRHWHCADCRGVFYPKGQLGLKTQWQAKQNTNTKPTGLSGRTQGAVAISLLFGLVVLSLASFSRGTISLSAASAQPLPNSGPNILTLVLLALTYLAGTILAVLGRRLPIIILGWGVIIVCLFGFSILIFGP